MFSNSLVSTVNYSYSLKARDIRRSMLESNNFSTSRGSTTTSWCITVQVHLVLYQSSRCVRNPSVALKIFHMNMIPQAMSIANERYWICLDRMRHCSCWRLQSSLWLVCLQFCSSLSTEVFPHPNQPGKASRCYTHRNHNSLLTLSFSAYVTLRRLVGEWIESQWISSWAQYVSFITLQNLD